MGKRPIVDAVRDGSQAPRHSKRPRIHTSHEQNSPGPSAVAEQVTTAQDLQEALLFDQSSTSHLRSGLGLFKRFLDSILYSAEENELPRKRAILRNYLDTQTVRHAGEKEGQFLHNLTQAWDFAAETNCEPLLSQVTAALALLFKVFASHNGFLAYGSLLAETILRPAIVRRFVRNTSAAPQKEAVIAPALRLLTELTKFNQGAHARAVYAKRDFTFEPKILIRNLLLRKDQSIADHVKKPSIRTTALRYHLAHLRYQDESIKSEILSHSNIVRAVFDHLRTDPPFLVFEVLDVFKCHVFQDKTISRHIKSRILSGKVLSRVASLYNYDSTEAVLQEDQLEPDKIAHNFLRLVCTDPAYGVMLPTCGLYSSTSFDDHGIQEGPGDSPSDLNLESSKTRSKPSKVRNIILSEFIQSQKPHANILHQELLIDIFKACPELVGDYFHKRRDFSYDPKLTSTWIGYSAFLLQTVQLPVPKFFGAKNSFSRNPPSVSAMTQSIIPQPLDQPVLSKCLNHSSGLVQLLAIRLLTAILHKLQQTIREINNARTMRASKHWELATRRVVSEVGRLCPPIRTIFLALKKPGLEDVQRESITRLLRLYHEVIPQVALKEKFDVSLPLCNALMAAESPSIAPGTRVLRVVELEHWIQMASLSPTMKWWQKHKNLRHSPFVTLLKLIVTSRENETYLGISSLLAAVLSEQDMLQTKTSPDSLDALIASLKASSTAFTPPAEVLEFFDDCCARFVKAPIKYVDDLGRICAHNFQSTQNLTPFSPLLMTFIEQWPFKNGDEATSSTVDTLAQWLSRLLYLLKLIGEDERILCLVRDTLVKSTQSAYKDILQDAFLWKMGKERAKEALKLATGADFSGSERSTTSPVPRPKPEQPVKTRIECGVEVPPVEDEKHPGLTRWRRKELSEAIEHGDIGELLLCLCSKHAEIRIQAINGIRQLMKVIEDHGSTSVGEANVGRTTTGQTHQVGSDLQQLYLLFGEILESVDPAGSEAFPYVGGVLAARCVGILADPTLSLFSTINKFLTLSPFWNVDHVLRYFWHHIVASDPSDPSCYHGQVEWYLNYLLDALRTPADMELFRRSNVFEQLLSHYGSRSCAGGAKDKIVRLLLRATHVGGSTTLITRCGLMAWVQTTLSSSYDARHRLVRAVALQVYETCDQEKVGAWSSGTMSGTVGLIAKGDV